MANPEDQNGGKPLIVRRGRVGSVELYEIKDSELDTLAAGSPATLELNFAIALISIAFACLISLFTSSFSNETVKIVFILVTIVGFVIGAFLLLLWRRSSSSVKDLVKKIKDRMPPEPATTSAVEDEVAIAPPLPPSSPPSSPADNRPHSVPPPSP